MTPLGTIPTVLLTCPACQAPVTGALSVAGELPDSPTLNARGEVTVTAKVNGLRVNAHDCIPQATR